MRPRRPPDFVIGPPEAPYLRRWWLVPRNRWCNVYLHQILRSDDDRALHDHPWWNVSIILRGSYIEVMPGQRDKYRNVGSVVFRRAEQLHRLVIDKISGPAWTLFITGPRVREWGFQCPKGWVPWHEFTKPGAKGQVGKGCGGE